MLYIHEIEKSLNGEINRYHQGSPAVFIRFAGCNFYDDPCSFCDTTRSLTNDVDTISFVKFHNLAKREDVVVLTGGEPLYQNRNDLAELIHSLLKLGYRKIVMETNGSYSPRKAFQFFPPIFDLVNFVMDYKPQSSGNEGSMHIQNMVDLKPTDIVKFPIMTFADLEKAIVVSQEIRARRRDHFYYDQEITMAFSPVFSKEGAFDEELANVTITAAKEHGFVLSIQLHKLLSIY